MGREILNLERLLLSHQIPQLTNECEECTNEKLIKSQKPYSLTYKYILWAKRQRKAIRLNHQMQHHKTKNKYLKNGNWFGS